MFINFAIAIPVALSTRKPLQEVLDLVERIRIPIGAELGKKIEMSLNQRKSDLLPPEVSNFANIIVAISFGYCSKFVRIPVDF